MFECKAIKWDRKFIFGLEWPPLDSSKKVKPYNGIVAQEQTHKKPLYVPTGTAKQMPLKVV